MSLNNPVDAELDAVAMGGAHREPFGALARIARRYHTESDRLLGFLLTLDYAAMSVLTCDPWKRACGGVPRNSFILAKLGSEQVDPEDRPFCDRMILGRITDSVPTPVDRDVQSTIFQIHKVRAILDPFTQKELQWSALKASIVGTYYDVEDGSIGFGNDVDTFFAPHAYEVYVPTPNDLEQLINSFVQVERPLVIGRLRYTETPTVADQGTVEVHVDPRDFVGREYRHRTGASPN